jgi:signal transduction histidine kinase
MNTTSISALRAVHIVMAVLGLLLVAGFCVVLSQPAHTGAPGARFEQAQLCIEPAQMARLNRSGLHDLLARTPDRGETGTAACEPEVALPHLARAVGAKFVRDASEPMQRASYSWRYTIPESWQPGESLLIYSPRLWGLAWQVRVNGEVMRDNLDDWRMIWNRPLVAHGTPGQFVPGTELDIAITIAFEPARGHSLGRVSIGSASALAHTVSMRQYLQETLPFASIIMLLAMGVFFFGFWWARRAEKSHLLLTCSCVAWSIFNLQFVLPTFDEARYSDWYRGITSLTVPWIMWLVYLFLLQIDRRFSRLFAFGMPTYVLLMSVLVLPVFGLSADVGMVYQAFNTAVAALLTLRVCWLAAHGGSLELRAICAALLLAISAGAHDVAVLAQQLDPEGIFWLPYGSLAVFGAFLFAVQRRYVHAIDQHQQLSDSLAERLAAREQELQAKQQRLLELERAHVLADERQRLMRDMHDGLGSTLTASLVMLEQGNTSPRELEGVLRECVDDLRAVIDSLEPVEGELATLLATLRFRLGRRMGSAGIELQWEMHDLPPLHWLGPPQALQVMRIVQEALTNILKHSAATRVHLSARSLGAVIEVRLADNGRGFDLSSALQAGGRGLHNLRRRAANLHAELNIVSESGSGTVIHLLLPVERETTPELGARQHTTATLTSLPTAVL